MMKNFLIILIITCISTACCSWDIDKNGLNFSEDDLIYMNQYQVGDTICFKSNLGNTDTIIVVDIIEEKKEGSTCFIQTVPYSYREVIIQLLPKSLNKFPGNIWKEKNGKKYAYQKLIAISKTVDYKNDNTINTGYGVNFKNFTTINDAFNQKAEDVIIENLELNNCHILTHGYPERIINDNDIEKLYWTSKFGLTAYSSKEGEFWIIDSMN